MRAVDSSPHPIRTFVGSNPAISAIFAIVLVIALVAVFRGMSENGSGQNPTAPTGGESHLAAITNSTPNASATSQANSDCVTTILTEEESAKIVSEWQAAPAPQVVPIQGPASATDADAASNAYVKYFSCKAPKNVPGNLWTFSVFTTRSVFENDQTRYIDTYVAMLKQQLSESRALSSALGQHYTSFVANADDPAVKPYVGRTTYGSEYAVLPQDFVVLADGRIGAPIMTVRPSGVVASTPVLTVDRQAATFAIFANVNGTWLLDETVALCAANCDQFFAKQQAEIDRLSPPSTPTAQVPQQSPGTATVTPAETSTPNASGTPQASTCAARTVSADEAQRMTAERLAAPTPTYLPTQGPASELEASAAITTYDGSLSCYSIADQSGHLTSFSLWSDRYFAEVRLKFPTENRIIMSEQQLAASRQLSPVLVEQDPTHYIVDSNDPAMQPYILQGPFGGNKYVLLPQDFVVYADGRIGAPVKWAFPGGTTGHTKDDYTSSQFVTFAFFANVDGKWLLDQQLDLCTWKCDEFYANEQVGIDRDRKWLAGQTQSTPSALPGNDKLATAIPSPQSSGPPSVPLATPAALDADRRRA